MDQLSLKCCLLCGGDVGVNDDNLESSKVCGGIVGGNGCILLDRQLEKMFILLKILEVPKYLCEGILKRGGGDEEDDGEDKNPDKWFNLCDKCIEGNVSRAWTAYQNILKWQTNMLSEKLKILEGMRGSVLKDNQEGKYGGGNGQRRTESRVDGDIKRYLFPELFAKVEQLDVQLPEELNFDYSNYAKVENLPYHQNSSSVESTKDKPHATATTIGSRKRGRPRKKIVDTFSSNLSVKIDDSTTTTPSPVKNDPLKITKVDDFDPKNEDQFNDNDHHHHDEPDYQPEMNLNAEAPPKLNAVLKRSRGRPFGSLGRRNVNRPRTPGTYYYQGTLKTKRFHWSICTICDARYPNTEDYTAHMALHSQRKDPNTSKGPLDCPHCPFPARDPQELDYHLRRRHLPKRPKLQQNYSCSKCPFTTLRWKYFKSHVDISHPTVPLSEFGPSLTLKCPDCDQQHVNILQYQRHRNKDHPQDILKGCPVQCPQCGIKFLSRNLLTSHVNSTHKRAVRHICDECGKGFEFANALRKHKEGHLMKGNKALKRKREHVCEICGMDFYYENAYKKHYKKQHGGGGAKVLEAPEMFQCKYCDLRSSLKTYIKRHIQDEHKDQMSYQCDKCERRYTNAQGLKRHERLNHGGSAGEVGCPHCGKMFKGMEYMKEHVKKYCKLKEIAI